MRIICVPQCDHSALQSIAGVNTGILLLRNDDDFSPMLWDDIAHVSRINQKFKRSSTTAEGRIKVRAAPETCVMMASGQAPPSSALQCWHLQAELEDQVWISTSFEDLCDQNVIVYLLRVKAKEYMPQVGIVTLCHATSRRCQLRPDVRQDCQAF